MKGLIAGLAILLIVGLFFFRHAAEAPASSGMTPEEVAQIAAEVDSVTNEWWAVWSAGEDVDRFMTIFADDPETLWISDGDPRFGKAEIDTAFRPVLENMQRQDNTPIEWRTIVLAPDVAYTMRINDVTQTDLTGNSGPVVRYAETLVWVKRDGEWKVLLGHGSSPNG